MLFGASALIGLVWVFVLLLVFWRCVLFVKVLVYCSAGLLEFASFWLWEFVGMVVLL